MDKLRLINIKKQVIDISYASISAIETIVKSKVSAAISEAQEYIYKVISSHIEDYYVDYSPIKYKRTYQFESSLVKTEVTINGNGVKCEVKLSENYLGQIYSGGRVSGLEVAEWANSYSHGGIVDGGVSFWDDAMNELGGDAGINNLIKACLAKQGLNVK